MQDQFGNEKPPAASLDDPDRRDSVGLSGALNRRACPRSPGAQLFIAIFLIGAGTLLFLDSIGILPVHNIWDFWPLILIVIGVFKLRVRGVAEQLLGAFLIVFGVLFLLLSLHVFAIRSWSGSWPLSLMLIAFGVVALIKTVEATQATRPRVGFPAQPAAPLGNILDEHSFFGNIKRRLDTQTFAGGRLECIFGSIEIDLRYTQIDSTDRSANLDVNCIFGSAKIRVPDTWLLSIQAPAILGNIEDKTIRPRTTAGVEPATLVISGQSVFGTIELEN